MDKFLLQLDEQGHFISCDVAAVYDKIRFEQWLHPKDGVQFQTAKIEDAEKFPRCIPVGTVEFCRKAIGQDSLRAINIPGVLNNPAWLQRKIVPWTVDPVSASKMLPGDLVFVKPAEFTKAFDAEIISKDELEAFHRYNNKVPLFLSEVIPDIQAEWRAFVYHGEIADIKPYILDQWVMPNKNDLADMAMALKNGAYTIDVAVTENGTKLLEVHNFIACGLYGFEGRELLGMLKAGYQKEIHELATHISFMEQLN